VHAKIFLPTLCRIEYIRVVPALQLTETSDSEGQWVIWYAGICNPANKSVAIHSAILRRFQTRMPDVDREYRVQST